MRAARRSRASTGTRASSSTSPDVATLLVTDQNFDDDAAVERELAARAGVELAVERCADEDAVVSALERHRPAVALVQFAPFGARAIATDGLKGVVRCG